MQSTLARACAIVCATVTDRHLASSNAHFNSVLVIDADGSQLGVYRKSHIPDGPGYQEKYYFTPGNTGFRVFKTRFAVIGVGVCWDQWFPEAARCMALEGAEMLLYPTAIGSEPQDPANDTCTHWQRCMQGHAAANMVPIVASNRIGKEMAKDSDVAVTFYGSSFITDHTGLIMADAGRHQEMVLVHSFNMDELRYHRLNWGVFRDRRPELYTKLFTLDGNQNTDHRRASYPSQQNTMYAAARALPNSSVAAAAAASLPGLTAPAKKLEAEAMMGVPGMMPVDGDATVHQRMITQGNFDLHEASFIGDVKLSAQRRPRGRCWVCRNKTTYECKICVPGPVPLCNRTARDCWCKYHSGEVSRYVPNKRGRKRRKPENEPQQVEQHPVVQHAHQVQHPVQHAAVTHETEQHAADVNGDDEANKAAVAAAAAVAADPAGSAVDVLLQ